MTSLLLLTVLLAPAQAQPDANLPTRPTTFMVDDRISMGAVENFREVYLDQSSLIDQLAPSAPAPAAPDVDPEPVDDETTTPAEASAPVDGAVLPIINDSSSWAEVVIGDVKVGVIGPLTNGAIHGVEAGSYQISLTGMTGYTVTRQVQTVPTLDPIAPGGEGARPGLDAGEIPTWNNSGT